MPELPEVEVLVRHLRPLLRGSVIQSVAVRRVKVVRPTTVSTLRRVLTGSRFTGLARRGKYLVFSLRPPRRMSSFQLLVHLGMTGRLYLQPAEKALARHAAVVLGLANRRLVFEDTRYFGRFTLDITPLLGLGPEPLSPGFTSHRLSTALEDSKRPIKTKLLDQSIVAGIGNIYANEALYRARIHPQVRAREPASTQIRTLVAAIRSILRSAIRWGSTVPLDWAGTGPRDGLFYYGSRDASERRHERLHVYGRDGQPCCRCQSLIQRILVDHRGTFFCPRCQRVPLQAVNP